MTDNDIRRRLERISAVYNPADVLSTEIDEEYIRSYYWWNRLPYSIFHHPGLIHMGITREGEFTEDDLWEPVRVVDRYLPVESASVLELATGRGANAAYLADRHPEIEVHGIDLSPAQLRYARRRARRQDNLTVTEGNYHDLDQFNGSQFSAAFIIESLCYSDNLSRVFEAIDRVLDADGRFIILGGYRSMLLEKMEEKERIAQQLVERGMAVDRFHRYDDMVRTASGHGFHVYKEENVSLQTVPTMERFERTASRFFEHPKLASLLAPILPRKFAYNAIAGYLLPTVVREGLSEYWITVLEKD